MREILSLDHAFIMKVIQDLLTVYGAFHAALCVSEVIRACASNVRLQVRHEINEWRRFFKSD